MAEQEYISVNAFCSSHDLDITFLYSLQEFELIQLEQKEELLILISDLPKLEKWVHLHYTLDINLEGLQAIDHLLQKLDNLHEEMAQLKNKLSFYEQAHKIHMA